MPLEGATFSSAQARQRDKRIEEKHRRELDALERKISNLKRSNDDTRKELFDVVHRAERLAECLGFSNTYEAQRELDMLDPGFDFRTCVQRAQELETAAELAKAEAEMCSRKMEETVNELNECKAKQKGNRDKFTILSRDYDQLKLQFAALELKFTRAADRYKLDYKKWRDMHAFLTSEDKKHRALRNQEGITPEEQDRIDAKSLRTKLEAFNRMDEGLPPPMGGVELPEHLATPQLGPSDMAYVVSSSRTLGTAARPKVEDVATPQQRSSGLSSSSRTLAGTVTRSKEEVATPRLPPLEIASSSRTLVNDTKGGKSRGHSSTPSIRSTDTTSAVTGSRTLVGTANPIAKVKRQHEPPSASPTVFSTEPDASDAEEDSPSSPSKLPPAFKLPGLPLSKLKFGNSSDTEEDSQFALSPAKSPPPLQRRPVESPTSFSNPLAPTGGSSDTEEDSQFSFDPALVREPEDGKSSDTEDDSQFSFNPALQQEVVKSSDTEEDSPISEAETTPKRPQEVLIISTATNIQRRPDDPPFSERPSKMRRVTGNEFGGTPRVHDENRVPQTEPVKLKRFAQPSAGARPSDYSVFKGKGRYSKKAEAGPSTSINSKYEINPDKNAGRDYQFDEVVRTREDRKKMNAGTCECCSEYYDAIGPLPKRLEPPLWRSPSKSQNQKCQHHPRGSSSSSKREQDIEAHKKNISRHRHNWERAKTPPDYWNIGFPSTQEVGDINTRAEKMHQQKVQNIEKEAASGTGKYRKR